MLQLQTPCLLFVDPVGLELAPLVLLGTGRLAVDLWEMIQTTAVKHSAVTLSYGSYGSYE